MERTSSTPSAGAHVRRKLFDAAAASSRLVTKLEGVLRSSPSPCEAGLIWSITGTMRTRWLRHRSQRRRLGPARGHQVDALGMVVTRRVEAANVSD
jgi:hypothetical protein